MSGQNVLAGAVNIAVMLLFFAIYTVMLAGARTLSGRARRSFLAACGFSGTLLLDVYGGVDTQTYLAIRPFFYMSVGMFLLAGVIVALVSQDKDVNPTPRTTLVQLACQISYLLILIYWVRTFAGVEAARRMEIYRAIGQFVLVGLVGMVIVFKILQSLVNKKTA